MKRLLYIPILVLFLGLFASCEERDIFIDDEVERVDNLPITLNVSIDGVVSSRSVDRAKESFTAGDTITGAPADVIHVQSTFELNDGGSVTRYCAMRYTEDGTWMPIGNASFAWPNDATKGAFTAYYVYGSNGALTDNVNNGGNGDGDNGDNDGEGNVTTTTTQVLFTDIVDGQDPLRADITNVRYGHTVELKFKHILTHLTLIELAAGLDDQLIFSIDQATAAKENRNKFKNAFKISLGEDSVGDPHINFEYLSVPGRIGQSSTTGTLISAPTEKVRDKETREESSQVGFFLEPNCLYNAFSIYFSNGDLYLSYVNSNPNDRNRTLDENNRYFFNVKKSAGVTVSTPPEQRWDESEDVTTVVDAEAFLRAVNTNSGYSEYDEVKQDTVIILEATTNPVGTLLKRNIRFKNPYYHVFPHPQGDPETGKEAYDFVPSIGGDNVFDGGYHYIKDLACPLFYQNNGVIKNLGLSGVNIGGEKYGIWESSKNLYKDKTETDNYVSAPYEYMRTGAIVTNNNGTVQNIRVKDLTMNVGIHATESNQEAHNVGALFGVNNSSGLVEKVYLSGKISVTVQNYPGETLMPEVNIGGLAGQNLGIMTEIEQLVDNRDNIEKPKPVNIEVINKINGGSGAYYIGGLVGNNTGKLSDVNLPTTKADGYAVTIDSSTSRGVLSDIGGVAGKADSSQGNEISSCLIGSGMVTAGATAKYEAIDAFSYTGGIVGVLSERTHVFNCTSFCSVKGSTGNDNVTRAAGGAFGNIRAIIQSEGGGIEPGTMMSIACFGEILEGTNSGCFVGEAPEGKTWDNYQSVADVKKFPGINFVGTTTVPAP